MKATAFLTATLAVLLTTTGAQALVITEKDWVKWRPLLALRMDKGGRPPFIPICLPLSEMNPAT